MIEDAQSIIVRVMNPNSSESEVHIEYLIDDTIRTTAFIADKLESPASFETVWRISKSDELVTNKK